MVRRLALTLAIVSLPIALLAYGLRGDPRAAPSPMVGKAAPEFTLARLDGTPVRASDFRGRVLVVNFWASWCVPCREEAEALEAVWRRYRDAGVTLIGVNIQDRPEAARTFLDLTRPSYPNVIDGTGATSIAYGIYGVPETFVVDQAGRIRARHVGPVTVDSLARHIAPLIPRS